ncbi:alpha/beta hydrolase [Pseudomonas sp.]|uniref:alpha/beta hydrolase n=1 Tax=Pseudomonas sp. TaxID=306 RepID=UPI003A96B173
MKYLLLLLSFLPWMAQAKPDLTRVMGETLAERGSEFFNFEHFDLSSADNQRHYRVYLAIPKQSAPASGYPVLYMLDGNAALAALKDQWFSGLSEMPLLVMIGYAGERVINPAERTLDYTPAAQAGQPLVFQGRRAGGASAFLQLIEGQIKPVVEAKYLLDQQRQSLWGHSFGGLFVLNTLFTKPQSFNRYIAASPSLWWQSGLILEIEKQLPADAQAQLLIVHGELEGQTQKRREVPKERAAAMRAVGTDALPRMVKRLAEIPGLQLEYQQLPGLSHGPMLPASIPWALKVATEPQAQ